MSVYAPITGYTWEMLKAYGVDPRPVFDQAGITPDTMANPHARIPSQSKIDLQRLAHEAVDDEAYGVRHTQVFHPSHLGPLGYAWMSAGSLRQGMAYLRRYSRMLSHRFVVALSEEGEECHIGFYWIDDRTRPSSEHFGTLAVMVRMCRLLLGEDFTPSRVEFKPARPRALTVFRDHFQCPMRFGQRLDRLVVSRDRMNRPLSTGHPEISRQQEAMLLDYLAGLDPDDPVSQARSAINDLLTGGDVTLGHVAGAMNTTERTLRRRLRQRGTSFRKLLDEQRQELGQRLVRNRQLSLTEISYLLGFAHPSAFSRAFRVWTGRSPSQARGID